MVNDHEDLTKRQDKVITVLRESLDVDETDIFNKEVEISALESTLSDKSVLCEEQARTIASLEKKAELVEVKLEMLRKIEMEPILVLSLKSIFSINVISEGVISNKKS